MYTKLPKIMQILSKERLGKFGKAGLIIKMKFSTLFLHVSLIGIIAMLQKLNA